MFQQDEVAYQLSPLKGLHRSDNNVPVASFPSLLCCKLQLVLPVIKAGNMSRLARKQIRNSALLRMLLELRSRYNSFKLNTYTKHK